MTDLLSPVSFFPLVFLFWWLFLFLKCKENTIKGVLRLHVFCLWFERCLRHHTSFQGKLSASGKHGAASPAPAPSAFCLISHSLPDLFLPTASSAASSPPSCPRYASFFLSVLISVPPPQLPPKLNPQTRCVHAHTQMRSFPSVSSLTCFISSRLSLAPSSDKGWMREGSRGSLREDR